MKKTIRRQIGEQTVALVQSGRYVAPSGCEVAIGENVRSCLARTSAYTEAEVSRLVKQVMLEPNPGFATTVEVHNETTLDGIFQLWERGDAPIAALNFASARNPGGGFLNGSEAQEESLARSSALYESQLKAWDYYAYHRSRASLLYSDAIIISPDCPVFRADSGALLESPYLATFLTCAAPNAGALVNRNAASDLEKLTEVFRRRMDGVLAAAIHSGCASLVLGAWGCGVFRNQPEMVATLFAERLRDPLWAGRFQNVRFSVYDQTSNQSTITAFKTVFGAS